MVLTVQTRRGIESPNLPPSPTLLKPNPLPDPPRLPPSTPRSSLVPSNVSAGASCGVFSRRIRPRCGPKMKKRKNSAEVRRVQKREDIKKKRGDDKYIRLYEKHTIDHTYHAFVCSIMNYTAHITDKHETVESHTHIHIHIHIVDSGEIHIQWRDTVERNPVDFCCCLVTAFSQGGHTSRASGAHPPAGAQPCDSLANGAHVHL